jgi:hypothetical protein
MMPDGASYRRAGDAMVARLMSNQAADRRALKATGRGSGRHNDWRNHQGCSQQEK